MKEIQLVLTNKLGLHARPAAAFVQTAAGGSSPKLAFPPEENSGCQKHSWCLRTGGARQGGLPLQLGLTGVDEEKAAAGLQAFFCRPG